MYANLSSAETTASFLGLMMTAQGLNKSLIDKSKHSPIYTQAMKTVCLTASHGYHLLNWWLSLLIPTPHPFQVDLSIYEAAPQRETHPKVASALNFFHSWILDIFLNP